MIVRDDVMDMFFARERIGMTGNQYVSSQRVEQLQAGTPGGNGAAARTSYRIDVGEGSIQRIAAEENAFLGEPYGKGVVGFTRRGEKP